MGAIIATIAAALITSIIGPIVLHSLPGFDNTGSNQDLGVSEDQPSTTVGGYTSDESSSTVTGGNTIDPRSESLCNESYPDFCIGPDFDCSNFSKNGFTVKEPDPYNLDTDGDGRGCEE